MEKVSAFDGMFLNALNLKYLNIYDVQNPNDVFNQSELYNINKLVVCEKDDILVGDNIIKLCCNFNIETDECEIFSSAIPTTIFTTDLDYQTTNFIEPSTSDENDVFYTSIITTYPDFIKTTYITEQILSRGD